MGRTRSRDSGRTGMLNRCKTVAVDALSTGGSAFAQLGRSQEAECHHGHHRPGCAGAGSRRRQDQGRVDREGLPGSALRRGQAELSAEAAAGRSADRGRPATRDRLAAAAHQPERQRTHPGRRRRISGRFAVCRDSRYPDRHRHARDGRRPSAGQSALLARSRQRTAHREGHSRASSANWIRRTPRTSSSASRTSTSG